MIHFTHASALEFLACTWQRRKSAKDCLSDSLAFLMSLRVIGLQGGLGLKPLQLRRICVELKKAGLKVFSG